MQDIKHEVFTVWSGIRAGTNSQTFTKSKYLSEVHIKIIVKFSLHCICMAARLWFVLQSWL